jgi:hypothetical protein
MDEGCETEERKIDTNFEDMSRHAMGQLGLDSSGSD